MNSWQHLLIKDPAPTTTITGEWFCVRFSPDKIAGEVFNVGVVFIDQDKQCHAKLLENTRVFEQMFGSLGVANIKFLLTVVTEALADNNYNISPSSHISYSSRQTAQGESIDEILDDLYHSMISLVTLSETETDKKHQNINTKDLRKRVTSFIKKQLPDTYHHFLQDSPILLGNMSLDIPIVNHSLNKKFYGTVVSADFSNEVHFFYNVEHIGVSNLANCCEILGKDIKSGISIYNPPLNSKAQQDERDEKIDKCLYRLERLRKNGHDIDIRIESNLNKSISASLEMTA